MANTPILSPEQKTELSLLFPDTDIKHLVSQFGITKDQIWNMARKEGWRKEYSREWSEEDRQFVRENYFRTEGKLSARLIAEHLGKTRWGVVRIIQQMKAEMDVVYE